MRSIERSLSLALFGSLALLMPLFWWGGALTARSLLTGAVHAELKAEAELHLSQPDGQSGHDPARRHPHRGWYRISSAGRIEGSANAEALGLPALLDRPLYPGQSHRLTTRGADQQPVLVHLVGLQRDGERIRYAIAEDMTRLSDRLRLFELYFAGFSLLLMLVLWWVQRQIVHNALARLHEVQANVQRLERGDIDALSERVPTEILPLVSEYNRLHERFEKRLRQSRNAAGNLAHALKGPLNLLVREGEGRPELAQPVERIRQLIDAELRRARVSGRVSAGRQLDLGTELPALARLLEQVYAEKTLDIRIRQAASIAWSGDRQDMLELVGNLLDNAVKWAAKVVILEVREHDGIQLEIEDDGPGCSPAELDRLTMRGVRFDETVAGHGLGLSIVKDIVESYAGELRFTRSARLGGLHVSVHLPSHG